MHAPTCTHTCMQTHIYAYTHADTPTCTTTYTCMRTHMLTHPPTCSHLQRCWALGSSLPSLQTPHEQLERCQVSSVGPPPASTLERRGDRDGVLVWTRACACAHTPHTCTCITAVRIGYVAPIQGVSQQKATKLVATLAAGTPASSSQLHGPLSAVGVLVYGLARPMRREKWGTALSEGIRSRVALIIGSVIGIGRYWDISTISVNDISIVSLLIEY